MFQIFSKRYRIQGLEKLLLKWKDNRRVTEKIVNILSSIKRLKKNVPALRLKNIAFKFAIISMQVN